MAQNFIACDRDQTLLMPPDMREWLPEGHLAHFVLDAVGELELEPFYSAYRSDGHGAAAFDPEMMVALLLYAYAVGERSSRRIERRLTEDVAFRVIAANQAPDHATIARFRARHAEAIEGLFGEILALCERAGLLESGPVAIDSTKIAAAASGAANRDYRQIAGEILAEADAVDRAEDERYGDRRGDELPAELAEPTARRKWLREERRKIAAEQKLAAAEREHPSGRPERLSEAKRRLEDEHEAKLTAARQHEAWRERREAEQATRGKRIPGRPPKRPATSELPAEPAGQINTTDLDSQPVRTHRGFIQGYNAHAATNTAQIVVAAELSLGSADGGRLEPMVAESARQLAAAGAGRPQVVVADAGYWSKEQIQGLQRQGIEALVPPDGATRTKPPPKGRRGGAYAEMRAKLKDERGAELYRQRQWMVEPVFAQIKVGRRIDRFKRRGLAACRSEWRLITATHNLLKLWRAQTAPLGA